jgi:hypothetical protein
MVKKDIAVKPYRRKVGGKLFKVKRHVRRHRKKGGRIRYKKVGTFEVGHDKYGNFAGSRVIPLKKARKKRK